MKKILFILLGIGFMTVLLYSCKKNETAVLTEEQAAANLVRSDQFVEFSTRFIPDYLSLANYHRQVKVQGNGHEFINLVTAADNDEAKLSDAYSRFSLDYGIAISLKNHIDNDMLTLFHQNPFLLNFNEAQVRKIIVTAMESGLFSDDPKWKDAKQEINRRLKPMAPNKTSTTNRATNAVGLNLTSTDSGLTIDEIWGCVKESIGLGSAGILGIAGLKELAKNGIQAAVINVSKWLAKKAGWVGAVITVFDFGSCIYKEAND